jgi:hypothetical protein
MDRGLQYTECQRIRVDVSDNDRRIFPICSLPFVSTDLLTSLGMVDPVKLGHSNECGPCCSAILLSPHCFTSSWQRFQFAATELYFELYSRLHSKKYSTDTVRTTRYCSSFYYGTVSTVHIQLLPSFFKKSLTYSPTLRTV